ncbi:hypothetical protein AVEN_132620-1 [Araneus ventricosus]|uniref:Uncharacterized protein n=1 Tax=Araneus ventricosus TaxID=182803 RepID=A0A4Y2AX90_ARAVE|nr:hypothetical protein AVEN_132620-1 [Araneus ventricosus]
MPYLSELEQWFISGADAGFSKAATSTFTFGHLALGEGNKNGFPFQKCPLEFQESNKVRIFRFGLPLKTISSLKQPRIDSLKQRTTSKNAKSAKKRKRFKFRQLSRCSFQLISSALAIYENYSSYYKRFCPKEQIR